MKASLVATFITACFRFLSILHFGKSITLFFVQFCVLGQKSFLLPNVDIKTTKMMLIVA